MISKNLKVLQDVYEVLQELKAANQSEKRIKLTNSVSLPDEEDRRRGQSSRQNKYKMMIPKS